MKHCKKFNHLGRNSNERKALLLGLSKAIIKKKRIFTTLEKGKALRRFLEPILTKSKEDSMSSRRCVFSKLNDKIVVKELFNNVVSAISDRNGGYLRIIKIGNRYGDNAKMCFVELVDFGGLKAAA